MNRQQIPGAIKPRKKDDIDCENNKSYLMYNSQIQLRFDDVEGKHLVAQQKKEPASEFDLSIYNVQLQRQNHFTKSDIPCINQLNQLLNEQVLYWNIQGEQASFNFPEHLLNSHAENRIEIVPKIVLYKPNSLFSKGCFLVDNSDKEILLEGKKNIQWKEASQIKQQSTGDPLNNTQLRDIWNTGMFFACKGNGEPEKWMISPRVLYGKKNCGKFFQLSFESFYQEFREFKRIFYQERRWVKRRSKDWLNMDKKTFDKQIEIECLNVNMWEGISVILEIPVYLVNLLIGIPLFSVDAQKLNSAKIKAISNRIEKEILGERLGQLTDFAFLQHFHAYKGIYLGLEINFNEEEEIVQALKLISEGNLQLCSQNKELIKLELQDIIYQNLIRKVCATLASNFQVNSEILTSLENTFKTFIICHRQIKLGEKGFLNFGKSENILKELQKHKLTKQENLVLVLSQNLKRGFGIREERHLRNPIKKAFIKFNLNYTWCIPKVICEEKDGRNVYSGEWKLSISVSSSFFFWKIILFLKLIYFWLSRYIDFFYYMAIYSPCGLKSAFQSNSFNSSFNVNQDTGELEPGSGSQITPITQIYQKIKAYANDILKFKDNPDDGFLVKLISRLCYGLYSLVFCKFLIGFILVNILLRLCNLLLGLAFLAFVPLSFVLVSINSFFSFYVLLICQDSLDSSNEIDETEEIEWDIPEAVPLLNILIWKLFVRGLGQILLSLIIIVFYTAIGVLTIILIVVFYIARRLMDLIVFIIIYSCGSVPGEDSCIFLRFTQKRLQLHLKNNVSSQDKCNDGKEVSTEQLTKMDQLTQAQIYQLVDAEFDRQTLDIYRAEMQIIIQEPIQQNDARIKQLLEYLPFDFRQNKLKQEYQASAQKLIKDLDTQIDSRKKNFTVLTRKGRQNFLYKQEDILNIYYLLQTYLAQKYGEHPFYSKFMWKNQQCEVGSYDKLALYFLNLIFFDNKIPPSEVLDKLTLKESQNNKTEIKRQIDEFLDFHYGQCQTGFIEPPQFISFSQFVAQVQKRQDPKQPLIELRSLDLDHLDEFIILNSTVLKPDNVIHQN